MSHLEAPERTTCYLYEEWHCYYLQHKWFNLLFHVLLSQPLDKIVSWCKQSCWFNPSSGKGSGFILLLRRVIWIWWRINNVNLFSYCSGNQKSETEVKIWVTTELCSSETSGRKLHRWTSGSCRYWPSLPSYGLTLLCFRPQGTSDFGSTYQCD